MAFGVYILVVHLMWTKTKHFMTLNEIKKALYRQKPAAYRQLDELNGDWCYYTTVVGLDNKPLDVHFIVPRIDMGDAMFGNEMPAQLLIRWIYFEK